MIATSVADLKWLDAIPGDEPVLVVAEGLVQYLTVEERDALFNRITEQFPSGKIVFDAYGRPTTAVLNLVLRFERTGLRLYGPLKDGHEIEVHVPRLRLVSAVSFLTLPEMVPLLIHSKARHGSTGASSAGSGIATRCSTSATSSDPRPAPRCTAPG